MLSSILKYSYSAKPQLILKENLGKVLHLILNRRVAMNAISDDLQDTLFQELSLAQSDPGINSILISAQKSFFSIGADIPTMFGIDHKYVVENDYPKKIRKLEEICKKPMVAAVAGYAIGGGFEMASLCDVIIAAENAKFGLPEITIGACPGLGGTVKPGFIVGKTNAMYLGLTGKFITAQEAKKLQIVSKVVPYEKLIEEALAMANKIAELPVEILILAKEDVLRSFEHNSFTGYNAEKCRIHLPV